MRSSAALFPDTYSATTSVLLRRHAVTSGPLFLLQCPRCNTRPATRLETLTLRRSRPWALALALASYAAAIALAARAPDFAWYHSLAPEEVYRSLVGDALHAVGVTALAFFAGAVLYAALRRRVQLRVSVCDPCEHARRRRALVRDLTALGVLGAAAGAGLVAAALGVTAHVAWAAFVPALFVAVAVATRVSDPNTLRCVGLGKHELAVVMPTQTARALREEHPRIVLGPGPSARTPAWVAPLLSVALGVAVLFTVDEAVAVCPPGTTGAVVTDEAGDTIEYCVDPLGQLHGRYQRVSPEHGGVVLVGGFNRGFVAGRWFMNDKRAGDPRLMSPHDVIRWSARRWRVQEDGVPVPDRAFPPPPKRARVGPALRLGGL